MPLAHEVTLPVLGVPVRFQANDAALVAALQATLGHRRFGGSPSEHVPSNVGAHSATDGPGEHLPPDSRRGPTSSRGPGKISPAGNPADPLPGVTGPYVTIRFMLYGATAPARREGTPTILTSSVARTPPPASNAAVPARPAETAGNRAVPTQRESGAPPAPDPVDRDFTAASLCVRTDHRRRLTMRGDGVRALANLRRFEAVCQLQPRVLENHDCFSELLDTLTLTLVTRLDRQPLHAAAVALNGRAFVLAGPSGTGKSTIAYAALRAGLNVLDDDAVYLQLQPRLRVWGKGRRLHLSPDATRFFPELAGTPLTLRSNGKWKLPVANAGAAPRVVDRAELCLLERGPGPVSLQPLHPDEADQAVRHLLATLEGGFHAFRQTIEPGLRALSASGVWRLRLSDDPHAAVSRLGQVLRALSHKLE